MQNDIKTLQEESAHARIKFKTRVIQETMRLHADGASSRSIVIWFQQRGVTGYINQSHIDRIIEKYQTNGNTTYHMQSRSPVVGWTPNN